MLCVIQRNEDKKYFRTKRKGHFGDNWVENINEATLYHSEVDGGRWSYFDRRFYSRIPVEIREIKPRRRI